MQEIMSTKEVISSSTISSGMVLKDQTYQYVVREVFEKNDPKEREKKMVELLSSYIKRVQAKQLS